MITALMPAHNAARFISEAIDSIQSQTLQDWELIIVDDHSEDDTVAIASAYAAEDPRIKLIACRGTGIADARNAALEIAQYDICAVTDADDVFVPDRFERQAALFEAEPDVVACGGAFQTMDAQGTDLKLITPSPLPQSRLGSLPVIIPHLPTPTVAFRRAVVMQMGCYRSVFRIVEDIDLLLRLEEVGRMVNLDSVLCRYRLHEQSSSSSKNAQQAEFFVFAVGLALQRRRTGEDGCLTGARCLEDLDLPNEDMERLTHQKTISRLNSRNRQRTPWSKEDIAAFDRLVPVLKECAPNWIEILSRERVKHMDAPGPGMPS